MQDTLDKISKTKNPSLNLAYDYVRPSYEIATKRFDNANNRIRNLMTLILGFTSIIPLIAKALIIELDFISIWFILMLGCFVVSFLFGIYAYNAKSIIVLHPKKLYNDYIQYSEIEFKERMLYWAGEHFGRNIKTIAQKCHYIDILLGLLLLEVIFAGLWLFGF